MTTNLSPFQERIAHELLNNATFKQNYLNAPYNVKFPAIRKYTNQMGLQLTATDLSALKSYFNETFPPQQPESKETQMSAVKFLEHRTYVNGVDIKQMSEAQIYGAIAAKEQELANLDKIENKPASLVRKIKEGRDEIKELVDFLDKQEPAKQAA